MNTRAPFGKPGPAPATRRGGDARTIAALLTPLVRPIFRKRSPAAARIMSDWALLVGPGLAARTAPKRLVSGTLTLACDGATALELQHLERKLVERINVQIGEACVQKLRFVHEPVGAPAPRTRRAPIGAPVEIDGVAGPLGETLGRLGAAIAARARVS